MTSKTASPIQKNPARSGDKPPVAMKSLAWLIDGIDCRNFFKEFWEQHANLVARNDRNYFSRLFSLSALDRAIGHTMTRDNMYFITKGIRKAVASKGQTQSLTQIYSHFAEGAALQIQNIHLRDRAIAQLTNALTKELGFNADASVLALPPGYAAAEETTLKADTFVLQISGSCQWAFREKSGQSPSLNTHAGDTLYLPKETIYREVVPDNNLAICLFLNVHTKTLRELLIQAIGLLAEKDLDLRQGLPFGFPLREDTKGVIATYVNDQLIPRLKGLDWEAAKRALSLDVKRRMPAIPDGHFPRLHRVDKIDADTLLEHRPGMVAEIEYSENGVVFEYPGYYQSGPEKMFLAMEFVKTTERFQVKDIPGWYTEEEKIIWARHLVAKGFLKIL